MRPEQLDVTGFGVFREPTVIDFRGTDLFALSGPTGAGKSTVIDALVFALYGSVPRYDNKNLVAPVISQGKVEARVRLDFRVGDDAYRIVRVVRAVGAKGGATTKEARLERVEGAAVEVLAGTADEVSLQIVRLLGLTYEHFTTCVVLPQGDFQRFLHEKPSSRQDLLVELLDLGLYGRMAQLARGRAIAAGHQRAAVAQQLHELAAYTPEHRARFEAEIATLDKLLAVIDETVPVIDALRVDADRARTEADVAARRATMLAGVRLPPGVEALADDLRAAGESVVRAHAAEEAAAADLASTEALFDGLADRGVLDGARRDHEARATEAARIAKGEQRVGEARAAEAAAGDAAAAARVEHERARAALDAARRADRAHEFVAALAAGEPCPVCRQVVQTLPPAEANDLDRLVAAERDAAQPLVELDERLAALAATRVRFEDLLDEVRRRVAELDERLRVHPDPARLDAELARIDGMAGQVKAARAVEQQARRARQAAEKQVRDLQADEQAARRRFDEARDQVAALGPPPAERSDLAADWRGLVAWAGTEHPAAEQAAERARATAAQAEADASRRLAELTDACTRAGIVAGRRPLRDVVVDHAANARADLDSLDDALARSVDLRAAEARFAEAEQVAVAMGTHLRSTGFEKWVLDEVLHRLVTSATEILRELSGGTYSLTFDGRSNFSVIDHANADAVRSARTLSGGETFLASLALALALADEVAQLAASGTVRLESIFLDEGFGTLDPDTLDTVATAIEELGARGRLVGLVTHVRDLAERLPVRFEIDRQGNASTVTRVDA